jgi:formylglycine-generating enzyme required for sulfatase activity
MTSPETENVRIGCKDVLVGRVDLLRALSSGGIELQEALAGFLGFEREPEEVTPPPQPEPEPAQPLEPQPESPPPNPVHVEVPFWQAHDFEAIEPLDGEDPVVDEPVPPVIEPVDLPPESLASGTEILSRLRRYPAFSNPSGRIDLDRTVARLSRGEFLRDFPRRPRKSWGQSIQVIIDRSRRLAPFWLDQDMVVTHLKRTYPQSGFQLAILEDGALEPRIQSPPERAGRYALPDPGSVVLVLGDLGCLTRPREYRDRLERVWVEWGRRFQANGNPALAIVPCHPNRSGDELARLWTILPWESASLSASPSLSEDATADLTEQLLTRLAFALRVEPRLVRAVRRTMFEGRADAGIEAHLWQHEAFASRHHEAATFDVRSLPGLLLKFFQLNREVRKRIYDLVRELRRDVYPGVWFSELQTLERDVPRGLLDPAELQQAAWWYQQRKQRLMASGAANDPSANEPTWFRQVFARLPESVNQGIAARVLHEIEAMIRPDGENRPPFLVPELLPAPSKTRRLMALWQVADRLVARPFASEQNSGSLLGLISTRNGLIKIDPRHQFWAGGVAPGWAADWGYDAFGAWVLLRVGEASQRLRWIPLGRFLMGSPEDEPGRISNEGPGHEETIPTGFWIFDTPCTQALWVAVMGENPSRQQGRDRPVESVSWDQCQEFLTTLNSRIEGLRLSLPSEAQWEYACRAGTETERYRENLDEIAWYGENSQYVTHPVGQKLPNDWGLYDTLGNVYEWCDDELRWDYNKKKAGVPRDPSALRMIRGGSWLYVARHVSATSRIATDKSPTTVMNLDQRVEDVARAIRAKLDTIKDSKVVDHDGQDVRLLALISRELEAGAPSSDQDWSERLATFLTTQRNGDHCHQLIWHVFDPLCNQGKKEQAQIIGEIVDLMLPLCLPHAVLSKAWRQLQDLAPRSHRNLDLGFRCAEFRAPGPVSREQGAERARERGAGCGATGDRDQASKAGWINLDVEGRDGVSFAAIAPIRVRSDLEQLTLLTTPLPSWASAIGRDQYGLWAEFTIEPQVARPPKKSKGRKKKIEPPISLGPVRQRLRWIPPGRFLMRAPVDEEGRYEDEGPQREVTIDSGFWMFDTPCTQSLWEALMDHNPSWFQSGNRPVEQASWNDCQDFLGRLNEKVGLTLSLPSEAQWEYACRAGTTKATYAGSLKIEWKNNAPILHEIAWYSGNSGIDFELSNGYDASRWPEKQFQFERAGTHPVGKKRANPWGLYDMLGNVWEWCHDYTRASHKPASAQRVFRGGSWGSGAQRVRAEGRDHGGQSSRSRRVGFRCAEFRPGREPSAVSRGREAEVAEREGELLLANKGVD